MEVQTTHLPGVLLLTPNVHEDERGSFVELYNEEEFAKLGITARFIQDNRSETRIGFIRGMHFQLARPQAKLVHVEEGAVQDIVIDLRVGTETFGRYLSVELSEENGRMLYVPRGLAHGFLALTRWAKFFYKVDAFYSGPLDQKGIRWDDPDLLLPWRRDISIRVNAKDAALPRFSEVVDRGELYIEPKP